MHAAARTDSPRPSLPGRIVTGFVVAFLAFDAICKILKLSFVVEASGPLGIPESTIVGIGTVLLICTVLYAVPQTAVLGAILLTGYLGGATAIHVRLAGPVFPIVFAVGFGMLAWAGLYLREPRLHALVPFRS